MLPLTGRRSVRHRKHASVFAHEQRSAQTLRSRAALVIARAWPIDVRGVWTYPATSVLINESLKRTIYVMAYSEPSLSCRGGVPAKTSIYLTF